MMSYLVFSAGFNCYAQFDELEKLPCLNIELHEADTTHTEHRQYQLIDISSKGFRLSIYNDTVPNIFRPGVPLPMMSEMEQRQF